jgi:hypothetical protein
MLREVVNGIEGHGLCKTWGPWSVWYYYNAREPENEGSWGLQREWAGERVNI